jgi:hypothetical protein
VPFAVLPIVAGAGPWPDRVPLAEVMHGPSVHAELSLASLKLFLQAKGYAMNRTRTSLSKILLRG